MAVTAAIFAGGNSKRFGAPKASALLDGEEFIVRIARAVRTSGIERVMVVGGSADDAARWGLELVADESPNEGPVGALLSALHVCNSSVLLTLPCDVPWIDADACSTLSALGSDADVRVALTTSPQWLCAAWRVTCAQHLDQSFANSERAIHRAIVGLRVEYARVNEISMRNANTPEDLQN